MSKHASDNPESWPTVYRLSSLIDTTVQNALEKSFNFVGKVRTLCRSPGSGVHNMGVVNFMLALLGYTAYP
jgi:translation elongation factor EF-4